MRLIPQICLSLICIVCTIVAIAYIYRLLYKKNKTNNDIEMEVSDPYICYMVEPSTKTMYLYLHNIDNNTIAISPLYNTDGTPMVYNKCNNYNNIPIEILGE